MTLDFFVKLVGRILGPVLQVLGLLGSAVPAQTQEGLMAALLNILAFPYVYIPSIIAGTMFTTMVYGSLWAEYKLNTAGGLLKREFQADLANWDKVQSFPIWQVAWLWNDLEPQASDSQLEGTKAYPTYRRLKEDLDSDKIKDAQKVLESWRWTTLSRQQLIDYALNTGEEPRFLFPKQHNVAFVRWIMSLFSNVIPHSQTGEYQSVSDLRFSFYSHFTDKGQQINISDIDEEIQKWLLSGQWEAIGRRVHNSLLFHYEKIPKKKWKVLSFDFVGASSEKVSYRNIRLRQVVKETRGNVTR